MRRQDLSLSVLLVQLDLLRHWNESTDYKDVEPLFEGAR